MQRMVMVCVVRCGEVRRSEKVVRRKKRKRKRKRKKKKRERKKKEARKKISFCCQFWSNVFNMPSNSFETSFRFTHQKRKSA